VSGARWEKVFEKLFEFLLTVLGTFQCWVVLMPYERGVLVRLGTFTRTLDPGPHWTWPLYVDRVERANVVPTTANLMAQSLQTKDGVGIVVSVVLTYAIRDIQKMLLEVEEAADVLADSTYALVSVAIRGATVDEVFHPDFSSKVFKEIRKAAFRWGIEVQTIGFADLAKARSLRLWVDDGD